MSDGAYGYVSTHRGQGKPVRWREWLHTKENDRNQEWFQSSSSFSFYQSFQIKKKKKSFLRNPKLASESSHVGGRNAGVTKQESHCGMRMIASEKGRFSSVPLELFN